MKLISVAGILIAASLCAPAARSQQTPPNQGDQGDQGGSTATVPVQPIAAPDVSASGSKNDAGASPAGRSMMPYGSADSTQDATQTESLPLSGSEQMSLAAGTQPRNFFDASGLASGSADSSVINTQGNAIWGANEVLGGSLSYDHSWNLNRFVLAYTGGGILYQPSALNPDAMFHALSIGQEFSWKRLTLRFIDQFSYSPNSLFGGAGIGGPGLLGQTTQVTGTALTPTYSTGGTIITGQTRQVANSAVAEMQYNLSRRSSFTVTGNYGLLDYEGGGYISSHDFVVGTGYNYMITAKDTLAVSYNFTQANYTGTTRSLDFQQVSAAYSHQVTNRLVFQISGGPEFIAFHGYVPSVGDEVTWNVNGGLQYQFRRSTLAISYTRGANVGSGVYFGSITQTISGSASHQFSRFLVGSLSAGYSDNDTLAAEAGVENQFRDWYTGASLARQFGRFTQLSVNYGALQQPYNGACPVASCGTNHLAQTIGVAIDVHLRPIGSTD